MLPPAGRWLLAVGVVAVLVVGAVAFLSTRNTPVTGTPQAAPPTRGTVVVGDNFDGPAGQPPNPSFWKPLTGGNGWGNEELQSYTDLTSNASLDGEGHLRIVARKEKYTGSDGIARDYTSARLISTVPIEYGRLEARILLPAGQGLWPAFWTVGSDIGSVGWPASGEIDVMEAANAMVEIKGTVHGPVGKNGNYQLSGSIKDPSGFAGDWHIFAIDRTPGKITWYVDGKQFYTLSKESMPSDKPWVYDKPQLVQLNVAVGGRFIGAPNADTEFPATMLVDYARLVAD